MFSEKIPAWVGQMTNKPGRLHGAKGSDICEGHDLAIEAWGKQGDDSGLTAFAYLWRRFGPPWAGCDDHKQLVGYWLNTPNPSVWLTIDLSGSPLEYSVGYLITEKMDAEHRKPEADWWKKFDKWFKSKRYPALVKAGKSKEEIGQEYWGGTTPESIRAVGKYPRRQSIHRNGWRKCGPLVRKINESLLASMHELLRPVRIRDVPINLFGRCEYAPMNYEEAEPSRYAGYGIPQKAMDAWIKPKDVA